MKNLLILTLILGLFLIPTSNSIAQESASETSSINSSVVYQEGDLSLNLGLSFGLIGYGYGYYGSRSFSVPVHGNIDYGFHEYISGGVYVGYYGARYGNNKDYVKFNALSFGVHGTFHASTFLNEEFDFTIDDTKIDYYGRLMLGYENYSWKYSNDFFNESYYDNNNGRVIFGPVLGVRYMFNPNIGGYVEAGRGAFGWLTLGISIKL